MELAREPDLEAKPEDVIELLPSDDKMFVGEELLLTG